MSLLQGAMAQPLDWDRLHAKTEAALVELAADSAGILGIAAADLSGDEQFLVNNLVFPQASAIKVPILMEIFKQGSQGAFELSDRYPITVEAQVGGSGVLQHLDDGASELSIRDLAVLMIVASDNTATNILIDLVGMSRVNTTLAALGLEQTRLRRKMMDVEAQRQGRENTSTPLEALRILQLLHRRAFVDPSTCTDIVNILGIPKGGAIASALPDGVKLASKAGSLPGVRSEWAIVQLEDRPYALVVMSKFDVQDQALDAIQRASRIVWEHFRRLSRSSEFGTYLPPHPDSGPRH